MLKKRIIPCLDLKDGTTVKGVNFLNLTSAGDPIELAKRYARQGADELVLLDITATVENRSTLLSLIENISREVYIPITVGGGISSLSHVRALLKAGADKISVNSSAVKRPELVKELSEEFGSQCIVVAVDTKSSEGTHYVHVKGGREATTIQTLDWVKTVEALGAGEILLTSMDADGTKAGFDLPITREVALQVNLPVIASGGAGEIAHFSELFTTTRATGALAASVFHFDQIPLPTLKQSLKQQNLPIR